MVLTAQQTATFFTTDMDIPAATVTQLGNEGIVSVSDLAEFTEDSIKHIAENLRRPTGRVADPDPNAAEGATIPQPPFTFGAKSQMRLVAAADLIRYYDATGRDLTPGNIKWDPIVKTFKHHWQALKDRKEDDIEVPKISRSLPIIKWTEAFSDYLSRVVGARTIPLTYIIREKADVPNLAPTLATNQPYSTEHGSVEQELIARASHTDPLFDTDNATVYYALEEGTRTTSYAASLKPFQRTKDGRSAWQAIVRQYAGEDKWRAEIKRQETLLHTHKWKGQSNHSLEKFIAQHRNAFVSLTQCAQYVAYQLPNDTTRVTYLLDAIECNDAPLQAAMALVRNDTTPEVGKMNDFESTAAFILPHDPVARKRTSQAKRPFAEFSDVTTTSGGGAPSPKSGIGKTGVPLRFHTREEYRSLTSEQKQELKEYRDQREQDGKSRKLSEKSPPKSGNQPSKKRLKSLIAAAVAKQMKETAVPPAVEATGDDEIRQYLVSLMQGASTTPTATASATTAQASSSASPSPAVVLKSILKNAKKSPTKI